MPLWTTHFSNFIRNKPFAQRAVPCNATFSTLPSSKEALRLKGGSICLGLDVVTYWEKRKWTFLLCVKSSRQATYVQEQTQEYALSRKLLYTQQH